VPNSERMYDSEKISDEFESATLAEAATLTRHALTRMQQRAIDTRTLVYLDEYGRHQHQAGDYELVFFDRRGLKRLKQHEGTEVFRHVRRDVCAVFSGDGRIVTVMHRKARDVRGSAFRAH